MIYNITEKDWKETRPEHTRNVFGKSIIPKDWSEVKMVYTKVTANGEFSTHVDSYHHVFFYQQGTGIGWIDEKEYDITPGLVVEVPAGKSHGYKNTGSEDLLLITLNIPKK